MGRLTKDLYVTVIHVKLFRCSVAIIIGPSGKDIIKGLPKVFKDYNVKPSITMEEFKECLGDDRLYLGTTVQDGVDVIVFFVAKNIVELPYEYIVHEMYHAMKAICRVHGVDDEETEAYMLEYLCNSFWEAQDEYDEQHPKKSKKKV